MTRIDLTLPLPLAHRTLAGPVHCTVFTGLAQTTLFVEAPNWGNAVQWGGFIALAAWNLWAQHPLKAADHNPADLASFFIYRLRPGFPSEGPFLWQEPSSCYQAVPRAPTLVQRLIPVPGTQSVKEEGHLSLDRVFQDRLIEPQALQMFSAQGVLKGG